MRHRLYGKKLGRNKNERTALFKSLAQELFLHGSLTTSESKAKAIKGMIDKIINLAKSKPSQRYLSSFFNNKLLIERLTQEIAPKLQNRVSGYTQMVKIGNRLGDQTTVVKMSLIGLEQLKPPAKKVVTKNKDLTTSETKKPIAPTKDKPKAAAKKPKPVKK